MSLVSTNWRQKINKTVFEIFIAHKSAAEEKLLTLSNNVPRTQKQKK